MKVLNFGSLNVDYVYQVDHILLPGETIAASSRTIFAASLSRIGSRSSATRSAFSSLAS